MRHIGISLRFLLKKSGTRFLMAVEGSRYGSSSHSTVGVIVAKTRHSHAAAPYDPITLSSVAAR